MGPFCLGHFSPDKIENCPAQFLAVCWIVPVDFKVHRLRDGFSVSNALLLARAKGFCQSRFSRTRIGDSRISPVSRAHATLSATAQAQKRND